MLIFRRMGHITLAAALVAGPALAVRSSHAAGSTHTASHVKGTHSSLRASTKASAKPHKLHGQQAIAPERVTEIQQALVKQHYLSGPANGEWDTTTQAAMQKFQADQGWQTKLMPDSRALKMLGLGADYSNAINAKGFTFGPPAPASTIPAAQTAGFTAASGIHQ